MKCLPGLLVLSSLSKLCCTACTTDEDCNLNGICSSSSKLCVCDPGWLSSDCGKLDLRPALRDSGYNLTAEGTSSWGSKIIHDPHDPDLYHLFAAEFTDGCGLDYWSPYSRIVRAESRTGPAGPYRFAAEVVAAFSHNPTVIYSEADKLYLLYHIGCPQNVSSTCTAPSFSCGPFSYVNGESGVTVRSSPDLHTWTSHGQIFAGLVNGTWDADSTNPSPFPLYSPASPTSEILLVYRGMPSNGSGPELINVASAPQFTGPYTRTHLPPIFSASNEDPFVWRDKRGNFHMLLHSLEANGGFGSGPNVGRHAYARSWDGEWTFNNLTLAFDWTVAFTDGSSIDFYRRERPQLYFSEDGNMTPLFMTNGVQEVDKAGSYSVIQPIGGD